MTYFGFLFYFLLLPIGVFYVLALRDNRVRRARRDNRLPHWAIWVHAIIALVYTTPWDNYLVATRVWWYDPGLVSGLVLGWVPIEEYTFFVLQPVLVGLWISFWVRRLPPDHGLSPEWDRQFRRRAAALTGVVWLLGAGVLLSGWRPGTYLGLELVWALPPLMLQLAFGGDILRRYGKLVLVGVFAPAIYLSAADALAISWGTWTINPSQSLGVFLGAVLPLEEFLFFLLTNMMLTFGLVLAWAPGSRARLRSLLAGKIRPPQGSVNLRMGE